MNPTLIARVYHNEVDAVTALVNAEYALRDYAAMALEDARLDARDRELLLEASRDAVRAIRRVLRNRTMAYQKMFRRARPRRPDGRPLADV